MSLTVNRNGTFPTDARSAAEVYLARGLAPIPLPTRAKEPGYGHWQELRPTPSDLDRLFPVGEVHNVGILNGSPSRFHVDVDLDAPEARRIAGLLLPSTGWVFGRPSSLNSHRIFRVDRDLDSAKVAFEDLDGTMLVELRGTGGLTVFPTSLHKESGERITWEKFDEAGDVPLDKLHLAVAELAAAVLIARHWPRKGSRDAAAMALTGSMLRGGWSEERVGPFLFAVATAAGDEEAKMRAGKAKNTANNLAEGKKTFGWTRLAELIGDQGEKVVRRARQWLFPEVITKSNETTKTKNVPARRLPPFVPFPIHCLPPILSEVVTTSAAAIGCDPSLVVLPILAVAAGCIGNARAVLLKRGWVEPCIIWSLTVNDSGNQKSPAFSAAVDSLVAIQMDEFDRHKEEVQNHQHELEAWKEGDKEDRGQKPEEPREPETFLTSDTTVEALGVLLEGRPKGLLLARDELDGWFSGLTRYRGKSAGTDRPQYLELHRAGTLRIDRLTRAKNNHVAVRRASVSLTGTIQLAVLARALDEEALQSGLGARFLLTMPPKRKRVWSEKEIPEETIDKYRTLLQALLDLPLEDAKKRKPHVLAMSPAAKRLWVEFYNEWGEEQFNAEGEQAACFAKIEGYSPRLMLLHHVVSHVAAAADDLCQITETSARAGIEMAKWFAAEAVRIYSALEESQEQRAARRVVEYVLSRSGRITIKELQKSNSRQYRTSNEAEAVLQVLVEAGQGHWIERPAGPKGGRPTKEFILCTTTDDTDETPDDDNDGGGAVRDDAADDTPGAPGGHAVFQADDGVSSVTSVVVQESGQEESTAEKAKAMEGVSSGSSGVSSARDGESPHSTDRETGRFLNVGNMEKFMLVQNAADLTTVAGAIEESSLIGLDVETTGLDPRRDRVRLLSIGCDTIDSGTFVYLIDCFAVDPAPLWESLTDKALVLHNAVFDLAFLARLGFTPAAKVHDTMLMSRVLYAGAREKHGLGECVYRELSEVMNKELQTSNWSAALSEGQLVYAARDAAVLRPLLHALTAKNTEAKLERAAEIEARALPAIVWMASKGVAVDRDAWSARTTEAEMTASRLQEEMTALAPTPPGELFISWNFDSPAEVKRLFSALGVEIESTDDDSLAGIAHPIAGLLRQYREATKKTGAYGTAWLKHVADDGRVYPHWNQMGAEASGRMSCSEPNMQQLPRDKAYRRCIIAPAGRVLVKADYSQIELRIAAKVSGDSALLQAYMKGEDLHTRTARTVLGVKEVTKEHRQLAKSLNFGLLYGMGAKNLRQYAKTQYGVELTEGQATEYRTAFFRTYPGLAAWHRRIGNLGDNAIETRTLTGRRRLNVSRFTEKLNTPVQGTGADGLKMALALLWERRDQMPGAFPVLAVHDEIVVEADACQAEATATWLKTAMIDAMSPLIKPVPVEVELIIAKTWGG